jgi:hypothetical protein
MGAAGVVDKDVQRMRFELLFCPGNKFFNTGGSGNVQFMEV